MKRFLKSFTTISMLVYSAALLIFTALADNPAVQIAVYLSVIFIFLLADRRAAKNAVMLSLLICLPVLIINPLINSTGATTVFRAGGIPILGSINITAESLVYSLSLSLKLSATVLIFMLMNVLIHPDKLLNLAACIAGKSVLVVTIAARLLPSLKNQLSEIKEIYETRGAVINSGNLMQRVKNWYPFAKIILISSLESSYGMAEAIEARGYGAGKRTVFFNEINKPRDVFLIADGLILLIVLAAGLYKGLLLYRFYPRLGNPIDSMQQLLIVLLIFAIVLFPAVLAWGCTKWLYLRRKI